MIVLLWPSNHSADPAWN